MIDPSKSPAAWRHCLSVVRPALLLAPRTYLQSVQDQLAAEGIQVAVARRDTPAIFDWIVQLLARQGISNSAAEAFMERRGSPTLWNIDQKMARSTFCPRLRSYWHFAACGFRRSTATCNTLHHLADCPVATIPARKGALAEAAIAFRLFVRDICDDDLVGWIDDRLAEADPGIGAVNRGRKMRAALLEPLANIVGTGPKVWSMILAELLLGGDPDRERWTTTGASFVAVDSLVHAFLGRTGILRRLGAEHAYGPVCYAPGGCAEIIAALAERINSREFNQTFPRVFPRWVQFAVWWFCAADGWATCNALKIDDRVGCKQQFCLAFRACDRLPVPAAPLGYRRAKRLTSNQKLDGRLFLCPVMGARGFDTDPGKHIHIATFEALAPRGLSCFWSLNLMGKSKLATAAAPRDQALKPSNVTPITSGRKPRAAGAQPVADACKAAISDTPAVVVFGRDPAGKAHASRFGEADAELAVKAAGLMGYQVLRVTSPDIATKALEAPVGRIFASGKGFVPFCKMPLYEALSGFEGAFAPPPPPEPKPEPEIAVIGPAASWDVIDVGHLVLAAMDSDDQWWPSLVTEARGEGVFVLRWVGYPNELPFVRRRDGLGLLPPAQVAAEAAAPAAPAA